jgi:hypothetical protein
MLLSKQMIQQKNKNEAKKQHFFDVEVFVDE